MIAKEASGLIWERNIFSSRTEPLNGAAHHPMGKRNIHRDFVKEVLRQYPELPTRLRHFELEVTCPPACYYENLRPLPAKRWMINHRVSDHQHDAAMNLFATCRTLQNLRFVFRDQCCLDRCFSTAHTDRQLKNMTHRTAAGCIKVAHAAILARRVVLSGEGLTPSVFGCIVSNIEGVVQDMEEDHSQIVPDPELAKVSQVLLVTHVNEKDESILGSRTFALPINWRSEKYSFFSRLTCRVGQPDGIFEP